MKRFTLIVLAAFFSLQLIGCGENKGQSLPEQKVGLQLADNTHWQAQLIWDQAPRYSDEEFLEMRGVIVFRDAGGSLQSSI